MNRRAVDHLPEAFLVAAVAFGPLAFGAIEPWAFAVLSVLICGALFFCALRTAPDSTHAVYRTLFPGISALILIGLIQRTNPWSVLEPSVLAPATVSAYATDRALRLWAVYLAAIWCVPQIYDRSASVRRIVGMIFTLGCTVALIGILQKAQDQHLIYGFRSAPYPLEPFGPYYNRNHAASLLLLTIFCGVGLFWDRTIIHRGQRERPDVSKHAAIQTLILFGLGICLVGLLLTRSLGALSAVLVTGSVLSLIASWPNRLRSVAVLAAFALAPLVVSKTPIAHIVANWTTIPLAEKLTVKHVKHAVADRMLIYRGGMEIVRDHPWWGVGLGAYQQAQYPYQLREVRGVLEHLHCDLMELLVETGLIGLSAYFLGLALFVRSCVKGLAFPERRPFRGLAFGMGGGIVGFLLHGLGDFSFQMPANALIFFVLLSSLGVLTQDGGLDRKSVIFSRPGKANVGVAIAAMILAMLSIPPGIASWHHLHHRPSEALRYDSKPRYHYELARHNMAEESGGPQGLPSLRKALKHAQAAHNLEPASPSVRALQGNILRKLGRIRDGDALVKIGG